MRRQRQDGWSEISKIFKFQKVGVSKFGQMWKK